MTLEQPWQAQWIAPAPVASSFPSSNLWLCYRKSFRLEQLPATALARIAVDSKYWLWLNGKPVVIEGQLKRGPTPTGSYFDPLELSQHLLEGENTLAVLVWYFGRDGFSHKSSGLAGLVFELEADGLALHSDETWRCRVHPAFGVTGEPHPNYRLPEFNLHFDARADSPEWQQSGFDDRDWQTCSTFGVPPCAPWGVLEPRPFPQWHTSAILPYSSAPPLPWLSSGETLRGQLPGNLTISPYFEIEAIKGQTIYLQTDNYRGGSEPNLRGQYITKSGRQSFEYIGYLNGHEVQYTIPAGVTVHALGYRESRFPTEVLGRLSCNDPFLEQLWQKCVNTMLVNLRDGIQDPDRERAQWWGDAVILLGMMLYSCDQNAHGSIRKAIRNLVDWRRDDGVLFSPVPGNWVNELPAQMLSAIGVYGFWTYTWYTGDLETLRHTYPAVRDYLRLWRWGQDGLLEHRAGDWDWYDWGSHCDVPVLEHAWYALALEGARRSATQLGLSGDALGYATEIARVQQVFAKEFWTGTGFRSVAYAGSETSYDDRANGLAVLTGFVTPEQYPAIRALLETTEHAGPYMEKYVLEALLFMGDTDIALTRMRRRYTNMVESPLSTLWEGWEIGSHTYGGGTYNHGWSGGPLTLISQYVAGLYPTNLAWETFDCCPDLGSLERLELATPTPHGLINLEVNRSKTGFSIQINVPTGTTARIGVPLEIAAEFPTARVNQKIVELLPMTRDTEPQTARRNTFLGTNLRAGQWRLELTAIDSGNHHE